MKASEALELSIKNSQEDIDTVISLIGESCLEGRTSLSYVPKSGGTLSYLLSKGYVLDIRRMDFKRGRNILSCDISWEYTNSSKNSL